MLGYQKSSPTPFLCQLHGVGSVSLTSQDYWYVSGLKVLP
jgi:hypothetical protein